MEEATNYKVEITAEAEYFYFDILTYFYKHHSEQSADRKSAELLDLAISLEIDPPLARVLLTRAFFCRRL